MTAIQTETLKPTRSEIMKQWWRDRRTCDDCGEHPIGIDDKLCPGCDAYRDHTGHY